MAQKRLALLFIASLVAGLLLTACAGVASGRLELPAADHVFTLSPLGAVVDLPALQLRPVDQVAFERALSRQAYQPAQALEQTYTHRFCSGGK